MALSYLACWQDAICFTLGKFELRSCMEPEKGAGGPDPTLKNHNNIGFLSNTGLGPLNNHKATKAAVNVGPS